jgi:6-phosphogluconolactonase
METQLEPDRKRRIQIVPTAESLAKEGARIFMRAAISAIERRGRFSVLLSGGSTPKKMFEILAGKKIPWSHIDLFWGDERMVPPDHPDSNYGMTSAALLSKVAIPPGNVHRVHGELPDAKEAALQYEQDLKKFFGGQTPQFDLVFLGIGPEGHTASLFPENRAAGSLARDDWVSGDPRRAQRRQHERDARSSREAGSRRSSLAD